MLKKLFPFLFKDPKKPEEKTRSTSEPTSRKSRSSQPEGNRNPKSRNGGESVGKNKGGDRRQGGKGSQKNDRQRSRKFGLCAINESHEGIETGAKVHIRQIYDNGNRFRVRGPGKEGNQISIVVSGKHLTDISYESVPGRLRRYYKPHSLFNSEEEVKEVIQNLKVPT